MRFPQRRQAAQGSRRARQWAIVNQNFTTSQTKVGVDLQSALETDLGYNLNNVTVSASRLTIGLQFATGSTIGDRVNMYFGMVWVGKDALVAGEAALPSPINDSVDWIMHGTRLLVSESIVIHMPRGGQMEFFSDSARKQREANQTLVLMGQADVSEHGLQAFIGGRVLFILP